VGFFFSFLSLLTRLSACDVQMAAMNPQLGQALQNPQVRAMMTNPDFIRQMTDPATMQVS
jgi:hypothetical protein